MNIFVYQKNLFKSLYLNSSNSCLTPERPRTCPSAGHFRYPSRLIVAVSGEADSSAQLQGSWRTASQSVLWTPRNRALLSARGPAAAAAGSVNSAARGRPRGHTSFFCLTATRGRPSGHTSCLTATRGRPSGHTSCLLLPEALPTWHLRKSVRLLAQVILICGKSALKPTIPKPDSRSLALT